MTLMTLVGRVGISAASLLILFGISDAQEERFSRYVGSEDLGLNDMDSGGKPSTAAISGLTDITDYAFDGRHQWLDGHHGLCLRRLGPDHSVYT